MQSLHGSAYQDVSHTFGPIRFFLAEKFGEKLGSRAFFLPKSNNFILLCEKDMRNNLICLLSIVFVLATIPFAKDLQTIAVMDFTARGISQDEA